jgi:hypothetical protein
MVSSRRQPYRLVSQQPAPSAVDWQSGLDAISMYGEDTGKSKKIAGGPKTNGVVMPASVDRSDPTSFGANEDALIHKPLALERGLPTHVPKNLILDDAAQRESAYRRGLLERYNILSQQRTGVSGHPNLDTARDFLRENGIEPDESGTFFSGKKIYPDDKTSKQASRVRNFIAANMADNLVYEDWSGNPGFADINAAHSTYFGRSVERDPRAYIAGNPDWEVSDLENYPKSEKRNETPEQAEERKRKDRENKQNKRNAAKTGTTS